jgi:hypothetical protein
MIGDVALYAIMLILPISALVARRLPVANIIKMALAWLAVFALLYLAVVAWQQTFGVKTDPPPSQSSDNV